MCRLLNRIVDKLRRKKGDGGRARVELVGSPSTSVSVNDRVQFLAPPLSTILSSSTHAPSSETPITTSISEPVLDPPQLVQAPEQNDKQASREPKLPKPYAINADLWNEALKQLKESNKHKDIQKFIDVLDDDSLGTTSVKSLAVKIQERINTTFKPQPGDSKMNRIIEDSLGALSKFTSAVDVAVSFDPVHAALPWAVARSVLVFLTSDNEIKSQLLAGIAMVTSLLVQCDTYQQLYMAPDDPLRPPEFALGSLKEDIIQVYYTSQLFLGFAIKQQESKIRHIAAPFKLGDVDSYIKDLSKCAKQLAQASDNCERYCNLSSRSNIEEFLKLKANFHEIIQDQIKSVLDRMDSKDQSKMLNWISSIPHGRHHNRVKDSRTSGTCEWLLTHEKFREWEDASSSTILWLQGFPGAGKTFLTSKVIDHIQALLENSPTQQGFAFFYCNRNENERREPLYILQSYVRQLSTTVENPECIMKELQDLCRQKQREGSDLGFSDCREQLLKSVDLYCQTTLVIDALDECDPDSRIQILEIIETLLSKPRSTLKVFISSRPDRDIGNRFLHRPNIEIQATHNQDDIHRFFNREIIKHENWGKMSSDLRDTIVEVLLTQSQGMFQWVFLQIKELLRLESESAIRDRLGKLPADLETAYDEIYDRIKSRNSHDRALADNAFKWVACAQGPLSSVQLLSAIRLDSEEVIFKLSDPITESQLLHLCNNLLVIDSQRNVWRFSHLSVTEYFEEHHWSLPRAHCHAASVCLKLLIETLKTPNLDDDYGGNEDGDIGTINNQQNGESEPHNIFTLQHPFQIYAQCYWVSHTEEQSRHKPDPTLERLLKSFLGSPLESSSQYRAWWRLFKKNGLIPKTNRYSVIVPVSHVLFAMCRFSFYSLLQQWWEDTEFDILLRTRFGHSLLELASMSGCKQNCENLIKRGAKVDSSSSIPSRALAIAVQFGHIDVIQLLLDKGADINLQLQYPNCGSALAEAVCQKNIEIVQLLVDKGADINLQLKRGRYGSALIAAVYQENMEIAQLLVDKGADINLQLKHGGYGSALAAAVFDSGDIEVLRFLVQAGADVDMQLQSRDYGNALIAAIAYDNTEGVEFLVFDAKADVNQQVRYGSCGSALAAAAFWGSDECANILIQAGAQVNLMIENGPFRNALQASRGILPTNEDLWREDWEKEEDLQEGRAKVAELLRLNGAVDEV